MNEAGGRYCYQHGGLMPKTTLIERMEKKGAPKSWIVGINTLNLEIKKLKELNEEYLNIIDKLARQVEELRGADNEQTQR